MRLFFGLKSLFRSLCVNCNPIKRQSQVEQTPFINTFSLFLEKIRLDISCESSARQRIHMKHQALFCSQDKSKKNSVVCCKFLFGALRVRIFCNTVDSYSQDKSCTKMIFNLCTTLFIYL